MQGHDGARLEVPVTEDDLKLMDTSRKHALKLRPRTIAVAVVFLGTGVWLWEDVGT